MFWSKKSSDNDDDHTNAEILTGRAIPQNDVEKSAAADHLSMQITKGEDPISREKPSWADNLPSTKK